MQSNPYKDKGFVPGEYTEQNYDKIDLHRPYVDDIILVSKDGKPMKREMDLIDVWFDSGSMPYAQIHYPFENKELLDSRQVYPADFIAEGVDQTRGWFFTLHAIATMVFDSVSYKAVISNGLVLDKNGNKMSKRLGNAVDPFSTIEKYGSDPLRWYMITNSSPWDNLKFDVDGIEEVRRKFFGTLYNTYSFFVLYANVDGFEYKEADVPMAERPEIDRWILSAANHVAADVTENMEKYELGVAVQKIYDFVWTEFCDWYIELVKPRLFAKDENPASANAAFWTLKTVLIQSLKLLHPYMPFITEEIFCTLQSEEESIMISNWPVYRKEWEDEQSEAKAELMKNLIRGIRNIRTEMNVAPSRKAVVYLVADDEATGAALEELIPAYQHMISASEVHVQADKTGIEDNAVSVVIDKATAYMPLADLVDFAKEKERLTKEKKKLEGELKRVNGMLGNEKFMSKAPAAKVAEERAKLEKYTAMMAKVEEELKALEK